MINKHDILMKAHAAFNQRDVDAVLELMEPDVDWTNGMDGGRVRGRGALREYWTRQWKSVDPRVEPVNFKTEADGRIAVTVKTVVRDLEGNVLRDGTVEHLYSFENNLVKRMEIIETPEK